MVILGVIAVGALSAITARAAVGFADVALRGVEEYPRVSNHTLCGHKFQCATNSEYALLERGSNLTKDLAAVVVDKASLEEADTAPMQKFLVEGALLWGASGVDIRAVVLSKLADATLAQDVAIALTEAVEDLSPAERQVLFALHTLAA